MQRSIAVAALVVFATGLGYWLITPPQAAHYGVSRQVVPAARASPVRGLFVTAPVERGRVRQTVPAIGTLQALVTVEVGTQLSGQIAQLFADFNDEVAQGQSLAQLDTQTFEARLAEASATSAIAEAGVRIQQARLERVRIDLLDAEAQRPVLQARVDNARLRVEAAQRAVDRAQYLQKRDANSATQVEEAVSARDQAAASLRESQAIALAHEHKIRGGLADLQRAEAELVNARAGVAQQKAVESAAKIDLERTTIRSPVDGVVVGRNVNEGQTVAASLEAPTLFTIAGNLQHMELHARVDEADIGKMKVGQRSTFSVDAYPGQHFAAKVTGIRKAPQMSQNVVTYTVVLATDNPSSILLTGMTATVRIIVYDNKAVLKLPLAALRFSAASDLPSPVSDRDTITQGRPAIIWRASESGDIEPLRIGIGMDDGNHVEVLDGAIAEGDEVVVSEVEGQSSTGLFGIRFGF